MAWHGAGVDVVARADHRVVGQLRARHRVRPALGGDHGRRVRAEVAADQGAQLRVQLDVAHEHAAQQQLGVIGHHELAVLAVDGIHEGDLERAGAERVDVPEGRRVHAHALELGAVVLALVHSGAAEEAVHDHVGHVVAGRDQARAGVVERRAFADRPDRRIGGLAGVAHHHAAALGDREARLAGEAVAGPDAGGEDDHVRGQGGVVGELGGADRAVGRGPEPARAHPGAHLDALVLDQQAQHLAAALVELDGHDAVGELDDGRGGAEVLQRGRGLEAQHAAAHDHAAHGPSQRLAAQAHPLGDPLDVLEGAIGEGAGQVLALGARRPRPGACGQHQPVIGDHGACSGGDGLRGAVDRLGLVPGEQGDPRIVPDPGVQGEHVRAAGGEPVRQVHAVVGLLLLLSDHGEGPVALRILGLQARGEAVTGHTAADHDDAGVAQRRVLCDGGEGGMPWGAHGGCSRTSRERVTTLMPYGGRGPVRRTFALVGPGAPWS